MKYKYTTLKDRKDALFTSRIGLKLQMRTPPPPHFRRRGGGEQVWQPLPSIEGGSLSKMGDGTTLWENTWLWIPSLAVRYESTTLFDVPGPLG